MFRLVGSAMPREHLTQTGEIVLCDVIRGCLKSPDSRQILSSMCSLQLPESWDEAYTTFCELGIGRTFQTSSYVDAHARLRGSFPLVRVPRRRTKNFVATSFGERLCAS